MKKLLIESVKIHTGTYLTGKTIFNIKNENEKKFMHYRKLIGIKGLKTMITFEYTEDDIKKSGELYVTIPRLDTDEEIKDFMISEINKFLQTK